MIKYFKGLIVRIFVLVFLFFVIITVLDKILYFTDSEIMWISENLKINRMNREKLQNSTWGDENIIWKYRGEGSLPPKGDKKRILFVGDSFIWGHGYSNMNHLWWRMLKNKLYLNGYTNVEIVAAGTSGYSTDQEFQYILKNDSVMNEIDPDLIIMNFVDNDLEQRDENYIALPYSIVDNDLFHYSDNSIINFFRGNFLSLYSKVTEIFIERYREDKWFQDKFGLEYGIWTDTLTLPPWSTDYENNVLGPLSEYINNELDCPLFFVPMTTYPIVNNMHVYINDALRRYNIKSYNPIIYFYNFAPESEYNCDEWCINPANPHMGVRASKFYSEWFYMILRFVYPDILGEVNLDEVNIDYTIDDYLPYKIDLKRIDTNSYKFTYPKNNEEDSFLYLPISKNYIKLNFNYPVQIKSIEITGKDINKIEIFTNSINSVLGYDDQVMQSIGVKKGTFKWELQGNKKITSLNISASVKNNKSTDMYLKITY